jgi:uncharacterized membrane protein YvlD (DUF360 family)
MQMWSGMMYYINLLSYNFLGVFFANYVMPGIEIAHQTKLPHIGGGLIFALVVGLINSMIYPVLKVLNQPISLGKIAAIAVAVSFTSYAILKFINVGVEVKSVEGFLFASITVAAVSFLTNYIEIRRLKITIPKPPEFPHP